jgi:hypothetical protein
VFNLGVGGTLTRLVGFDGRDKVGVFGGRFSPIFVVFGVMRPMVRLCGGQIVE